MRKKQGGSGYTQYYIIEQQGLSKYPCCEKKYLNKGCPTHTRYHFIHQYYIQLSAAILFLSVHFFHGCFLAYHKTY